MISFVANQWVRILRNLELLKFIWLSGLSRSVCCVPLEVVHAPDTCEPIVCVYLASESRRCWIKNLLVISTRTNIIKLKTKRIDFPQHEELQDVPQLLFLVKAVAWIVQVVQGGVGGMDVDGLQHT